MYYKDHLNIIENKIGLEINDLEILCLTLNKNVKIFFSLQQEQRKTKCGGGFGACRIK